MPREGSGRKKRVRAVMKETGVNYTTASRILQARQEGDLEKAAAIIKSFRDRDRKAPF